MKYKITLPSDSYNELLKIANEQNISVDLALEKAIYDEYHIRKALNENSKILVLQKNDVCKKLVF